MNEDSGFIATTVRALAESTAVILALWGALGGATNALTTRMRLRDALRHILLGLRGTYAPHWGHGSRSVIAAGMGSLSMAIVTAWLGLPPQAIPAGGAAGSAAYLVGVFGPAFIELVLARLRGAKGGADDE
jgi:hypothetical protein